MFVMLSCMFIAAFWSPVGNGRPLGSLVCDLLVFLSFPVRCPGSSVVLDCSDS